MKRGPISKSRRQRYLRGTTAEFIDFRRKRPSRVECQEPIAEMFRESSIFSIGNLGDRIGLSVSFAIPCFMNSPGKYWCIHTASCVVSAMTAVASRADSRELGQARGEGHECRRGTRLLYSATPSADYRFDIKKTIIWGRLTKSGRGSRGTPTLAASVPS